MYMYMHMYKYVVCVFHEYLQVCVPTTATIPAKTSTITHQFLLIVVHQVRALLVCVYVCECCMSMYSVCVCRLNVCVWSLLLVVSVFGWLVVRRIRCESEQFQSLYKRIKRIMST